jgi:uncharacterized protein YuzE
MDDELVDAFVALRVTYDAEVDAAYIYFVPEIGSGGVDRTVCVDEQEIGGMVNLDLDPDGRVLGVELLDASAKLPLDLLKKLGRA